jgi:hypothetical protein
MLRRYLKIQRLRYRTLEARSKTTDCGKQWIIEIHLEGPFGDDIESEHVNHMADVLLVAQPHGIRLDDAQRRIHRKQCTRDSHHLDGLFFASYR